MKRKTKICFLLSAIAVFAIVWIGVFVRIWSDLQYETFDHSDVFAGFMATIAAAFMTCFYAVGLSKIIEWISTPL